MVLSDHKDQLDLPEQMVLLDHKDLSDLPEQMALMVLSDHKDLLERMDYYLMVLTLETFPIGQDQTGQ